MGQEVVQCPFGIHTDLRQAEVEVYVAQEMIYIDR